MKPWISAVRLRTLPLSVSGIVVGSCIAYYNGFFKISIFIFAILTTLSLQVLSNLANDYGDGIKGTDNQNRLGPERAIQSGKITPEQMYDAIKINILIVILLTFLLIYSAFNSNQFLYSLLFFVLALLSIYAAVKYTVGSTAYGYRALGDIMVFLFFGLVSVMGTYFLFARQLDHILIFPACIIGLLSTGVLNLNNMRDIESDRASNKITIAAKLGVNKAKIYHSFLIISAMLLSILFAIFYYRSISNLVFMIIFIPLTRHTIKVINIKDPKLLDPQLKLLALSTFALAFLLGIGYIYNAM
ncbi:MAG: 1,4-dihydroxy-2-naphthoate octaprenyltransferase [Bacteroidetes bacterium]|nr:MAG: 1,4-dihydroxy-2-naphthoate octaprenyltransferase [Bacteroidota bacterium]